MIRSIIIVTLLIPFLIIAFPFCLVGVLIGKWSPKIQFGLAKIITKLASNIFFFVAHSEIILKGQENLPRDCAVLFVGNHKSYIDIPLMIKYVPFPLAFISKVEVKKIPLFSNIMTLLGCLFMDRENLRQSLGIIKEGIAKLERGESLLIFPEGTRSRSNELLTFKQGSLKLAEKSHSVVVPFAIKGTNSVFGDNGFKIKTDKIWLTFGEPIQLDNLSPEEQKKSATYVQHIIQGLYDEMIEPA